MKIYAKIHAAKQEIGVVKKNAKNPHFKNTYADLFDCAGCVKQYHVIYILTHDKMSWFLRILSSGVFARCLHRIQLPIR